MGGGAGEKPPWRASASGAKAGSAPRARSALEGRTSGGHRPPADFGPLRYGCAAGVKLWSRSSFFALRGASGCGRRQESTGPGRGADRRAEQGPEDENPRSVTGARQTRAVSRGVSRRGRAKRRGRRVTGLETRRVDPRPLMRCRGRKPRRVPSGVRRRRRSSGVPWRGARDQERRDRLRRRPVCGARGKTGSPPKRLAGSVEPVPTLLLAPGFRRCAQALRRESGIHDRPGRGDASRKRRPPQGARGDLSLCRSAQPHEGRSGAREGEPRASADPDGRRTEQEPWRADRAKLF